MRPSKLAFAAVLSASMTNAAYLNFPDEYKRDNAPASPSKTVVADIGRMPFVTGSVFEGEPTSFFSVDSFAPQPTPANYDREKFVQGLRSWASQYLEEPISESGKVRPTRSINSNSTAIDIFEQFVSFVTPFFPGEEKAAGFSLGARSPKDASKDPQKESIVGGFPDPFDLMDSFTKVIARPFVKRDSLEEAFQNALGSVMKGNSTTGSNSTTEISANASSKADQKGLSGGAAAVMIPVGVAGGIAGKFTEGAGKMVETAGKATSTAGQMAQKAGSFASKIAGSFFKRDGYDGAYRGSGISGSDKGLDLDEGSFFEGQGCTVEDLKKYRNSPGKERVNADP